jgi:transposase
MDTENSRKRRRHSAELKAQILAECAMPGASVAKVAMAHGINANIVHGWRKLTRETGAVTVSQQFVPVTVATSAVLSSDKQAIEVELRCGAVVMKVTWPVAAATDFAAWTRELLR